jgi:hypothetical protein
MQVHRVKKSGEVHSTIPFSDHPLLEPVKAIQVRQPKTFVIGQCDGNGVIMDGDEFERAVVIIMDSFVGEDFICTAHGDVVAVLVPADIYFVTRHAIEVCERALDGFAVDMMSPTSEEIART